MATSNDSKVQNPSSDSSIPQQYDSKISEAKWQKFWEQEGVYVFDESDLKTEVYSIDTPPPTVSGKMHLGHACSYTQQDFIARYKRMKGFNVFYPFGTDDNGLATEKLVQKEKKVNLRKLPRSEAIRICLEYLDEARHAFIGDWKNIGMSCDFKKLYSTIDDHSRCISQRSFLQLAKKSLVERRRGPVLWDPQFQTAIAQAELEDKKTTGWLSYVKAKLSGTGVEKLSEADSDVFVIYATTRPEMLYACVGMSVEEKGTYVRLKVKETNEIWITGKETYAEKFSSVEYEVLGELTGKDLIGLSASIPFLEKSFTISHDEAVRSDLGSGIAYFCSYGGQEDIEWVIRHKAEPINLIGKDGKLLEIAGDYAELNAAEARKKIIVDLEKAGHIIFKEKKEQIVNVGERSGREVEFIVSQQWYVNYLDRKEEFLAASDELGWNPKHMKSRLDNWIKGLNWDWGFSRQRHYGISIPVWYDKSGKVYYADESQLPVDPTVDRPLGVADNIELTGEIDVFDTWFTSSSTPFLGTELVKDEKVRARLFPMSLRPQAHDIINFWMFYTMAKTRLLYGVNPWKDVTISGFVLDPRGNKMSKSKGNVVAPQDVMDKFSGDAIRYWSAGSKLGEDLPYQEKDVKTGQKFVNKLWNASKFSMMHLSDFDVDSGKGKVTEVFDHWLLAKMQRAIDSSTAFFDNYEYARAKGSSEIFFWQMLCDQYLEIVKDRLYNPDSRGKAERTSAQAALWESLWCVVRLMAPITPHICEEIYQLFFRGKVDGCDAVSVHNASWPVGNQLEIDASCEKVGDMGIEIINAVRKYKSTNKLSLKEELSEVVLSCSEENFEKDISRLIDDLKAVTHVKEFVFSSDDISGAEVLETEKFGIKLLVER